jgi:hypothetical protein
VNTVPRWSLLSYGTFLVSSIVGNFVVLTRQTDGGGAEHVVQVLPYIWGNPRGLVGFFTIFLRVGGLVGGDYFTTLLRMATSTYFASHALKLCGALDALHIGRTLHTRVLGENCLGKHPSCELWGDNLWCRESFAHGAPKKGGPLVCHYPWRAPIIWCATSKCGHIGRVAPV